MHVKILLFVLCYVTYVKPISSTINYLGCYKFLTKPTGCQLQSKEEQLELSNKITTSVANGLQWLREQQKHKLWFNIYISAWVLSNLMTSGYINDGGICTRTIQDAVTKSQTLNIDDVTTGQLAYVMIGMRATCKSVTDFKKQNLIEIVTDGMWAFPKRDFNNYYQYSLGVLALYVNGAHVPVEFGWKLLRHLLTSSNQGLRGNAERMFDTEALSLIALAAVTRQNGMPAQFLKEAFKVIKSAEKIIDKMMEAPEYRNLITMTHVLQVLQLRKTTLPNKPYCKRVTEWILSQQKETGEFDMGLMGTAGVLPLLSGFSILEIKNIKCPLRTDDDVDEQKIKDFIASRTRKTTEEPIAPKGEIEVSVNLASAVEGVSVNGHVTVNLKKGSTALYALKEASKRDHCYRFVTVQTVWGPFIKEICKIKQNTTKGMYWMYYVNGKLAPVGAGAYILKHEDVVTFQYERR